MKSDSKVRLALDFIKEFVECVEASLRDLFRAVPNAELRSGEEWAGLRNFAAQQGHVPPLRNVDNDVPPAMRQEILAATYDLLPLCGAALTEAQIYYGIEQMLGVQAAGNPMAGWRQRLGRDLGNAQWVRIYDAIILVVGTVSACWAP